MKPVKLYLIGSLLVLICLATSFHLRRVSPRDEDINLQTQDLEDRVKRQDRSPDNTTSDDETNTTTVTSPTTEETPSTSDKMAAIRRIKILVGTLASFVIITILLSVFITWMVIWGCRMSKRRRKNKELVLRTQQVIFEGVPNVVPNPSWNEITASYSVTESVGIDDIDRLRSSGNDLSNKLENSNKKC